MKFMAVAAACVLAFGGMVSEVSGADGAWTGGATGNWSDTANWRDGVYASGIGAAAYFTNGVSARVWQDVAGLTLGHLHVAGGSVTVTNSDVTFNGAGPATVTVAGAADTANMEVRLYGTAGQPVVKEGDGTLILAKYLSGLGGMTLNGGLTLLAFVPNSDGLNVGSGTITVNPGATLKTGGANQINNQAVIDIKPGGVFDVNGMTDNIGAFTGAGVVSNATAPLILWPNGVTRVFSGQYFGSSTVEPRQTGLTVGGEASFQNVWFNLFHEGALAFAPGVGRCLLGGITTTNAQVLALQDTAGAPITLALGSRNGNMTLAALLTGPGGLEKAGTATLTLTNDHSFVGPTLVSGGTLVLGDGVRDGLLTNSASLTVQAGRTLAFNTAADQTYAIPLGGAGTVTKTGAGTLALGDLRMAPGTFTVNGGTLALNGGSSSGVTFTVNSGGVLNVNGLETRMGGFTANAGSRIMFSGGSVTGATLAVAAAHDGPVRITGGTHLFSSTIGNNHARYEQTGGTSGFVGTDGYNNTNEIFATVSGGTMRIGTVTHPRGLGLLVCSNATVNLFDAPGYFQRLASDGKGHTIIVTNNATLTADSLQFMSTGGTPSTGRLDLAGGVFTVGSLNNNNGNDTSRVFVNFNSGLLRFTGNPSVAANAYATFNVWQGGARIDSGAGTPSIRQPLVGAAAGADGGLVKTGAGTLTLTTNNTYAGQTAVRAGTLASQAVTDAPFGFGPVSVEGGTLSFTPTGSGLTPDLTAAGGAAENTVTYGNGPSCLRVVRGSHSALAVTLGNSGAAAGSVLSRAGNGVLAVWPGTGTATLGGSEKLRVNGGVATVNGMVPAVIGVHNDDRRSCDFLTYDAADGFKVATYTAGLGGGAASLANVTANTATDSAQVFALRVHDGAVLTINGGQTLRVGDGVNPAMVIVNNSASVTAGISGGTLDFATSEGIISFNLRRSNQFVQPISSVITGSGGLTLAGGGSDQDLLLSSSGNTYTGGTRLMAGCVALANAQGFGNGEVAVYGNEGGGGQFKFAFAGTMTNTFRLSGVGGTPSSTPAGAVRFDANGTLSGPVELMADTRLGVPAAGSVGTLSGSVFGAGALEIGLAGQAWGRVRLSGAHNTYAGGTRVSGGTLEVAADGALGAGPVVNHATLVFSGAGDMAVTNAVSGTGRVVHNGTGRLTLSGANTATGPMEVNAGTLVIGDSAATPAALSLGGTLDLVGADLAVGTFAGSGTVSNSVAGAATLTVGQNNADGIFWGAIRDGAGTLSLNKTGSGTLALSGLSDYSGETVIGAGTLRLQGVQTAPLSRGLAYRIDASEPSSLVLDSGRVAVWNDVAGTGVAFSQTVTHLQPVYVSDAINGKPAVRFDGLMTNRMVAAKTVNAQTVFIVNKMTAYQNLQGIWGRAANDQGIRANLLTRWQIGGDGNDFTYGGQMFINGVETETFAAGEPHLLSAASVVQRTGWQTAIGDYWGNAGFRRAYSGDIGELLVYDTLLSGAERQMVEQYLSHKWLGLSMPVPTNVLPVATALVVSNNAALDLNGISQAVGSLSGAGAVLNGSATWAVFTVGNDNTDTLFAGTVSGSNVLVKSGSGTLTLSGANAHLGGTFVSGGTLRLAGGADRLPPGGAVDVAAGATLDLNGQPQTVASAGGSGTVAGGSLTVTETLAPGGVGTVGTLTLAQTPVLAGVTLRIDTRADGDCDVLNVTDDLDLSGLTLHIEDTAQMQGYSYTVVTCSGTLGGSFAAAPNLPESWLLRYDRTPGAGKVELIHNRGTVILLR